MEKNEKKLLAELNRLVEKYNNEIKVRKKVIYDSNNFINWNIVKDDKELLIGALPNILLSKKYFPSNDKIIFFARNQLNINMPGAEKRSRSELIGRIIEAVALMNINRLALLRKVMDTIMGKVKTNEVKDFFSEWDNIIKNLNLNR